MSNQITEAEILAFLSAIERGKVTLTPECDPQTVYAGNVTYRSDTGWQIVIFNDANEWDYVDSVTTNDGRHIGFDDLDQMPALRVYELSDEVSWQRYRIPGHMKFRCSQCGERLKGSPPRSCDRCES